VSVCVANAWQHDHRPQSAANDGQRVFAGQPHVANDDHQQPLSVGQFPYQGRAGHRHVPVPLGRRDDGETVTVPRAAVDLLVAVLANMAAGQGVSLVPAHAELTTQQAADLMNVSRPFLVRLLRAGDIEYRLVGTHRRIKAASLSDYMRRDDAQRRKAADELTVLTQDMGIDE
jgi:excisionase family DNA binding protein